MTPSRNRRLRYAVAIIWKGRGASSTRLLIASSSISLLFALRGDSGRPSSSTSCGWNAIYSKEWPLSKRKCAFECFSPHECPRSRRPCEAARGLELHISLRPRHGESTLYRGLSRVELLQLRVLLGLQGGVTKRYVAQRRARNNLNPREGQRSTDPTALDVSLGAPPGPPHPCHGGANPRP